MRRRHLDRHTLRQGRERIRIPGTPAAVGRLTCAVVIPCHNYGHYLAEAIESVRSQTVHAAQIVVVDDSSTDNTPQVARQFPEVLYLRTEHRSEFFARRDGFERTDADAVVFLDADDKLPANYIAEGLKLLQSDWRIGVVGTDRLCFGSTTATLPHNADRLRRQNGVHAGAMIRATAIRMSGLFDHPPPSWDTHADWWSWRHLAEYGWRFARSPAGYHYRRGHHSMSGDKKRGDWFVRAGHQRARVSILIPLAGRLAAWEQLSAWLDRQTWPRECITLRLLDNSHSQQFGRIVRDWVAGCGYEDVRYQISHEGQQGLADADRYETWLAAQRVVCRLWTTLTRRIDTPWTLCLEDDVIPPLDVIERLLRRVDRDTIDAVACPYMGRTGEAFIVMQNGRPVRPGQLSGVQRVDSVGFGCVLVRSELLEQHVFTTGPKSERHWFDWWFWEAHDLHLLCDFDLLADHLAAPR